MDEAVRAALEALRSAGWRVRYAEPGAPGLPPVIAKRYGTLPVNLFELIGVLEEALSPDEAVWLLGARHYRQDSEYAFAWNEWERLSLEAADGDPAWQERIRAFWDRHLPIANSVRTGYAYVAFSLDEACFVVGREPEFEETRRVAGGLDELLTLLAEPASELRF